MVIFFRSLTIYMRCVTLPLWLAETNLAKTVISRNARPYGKRHSLFYHEGLGATNQRKRNERCNHRSFYEYGFSFHGY
jgi:hypothetical protein